MERKYSVTLRFNPNQPHSLQTPWKEYNLFVTEFKDYLLSLGLFDPNPETFFAAGSHIFARMDGGSIIDITHPGSEFALSSICVQSAKHLEELEAVKYALATARKLELARHSFKVPLSFNPNSMGIFVGEDPEGNYILYKEFIPNAKELQKRLYGGGNIAYGESSGHFSIFLGVEDEIRHSFSFSGIINTEGVAKPANSLDDLLSRL